MISAELYGGIACAISLDPWDFVGLDVDELVEQLKDHVEQQHPGVDFADEDFAELAEQVHAALTTE